MKIIHQANMNMQYKEVYDDHSSETRQNKQQSLRSNKARYVFKHKKQDKILRDKNMLKDKKEIKKYNQNQCECGKMFSSSASLFLHRRSIHKPKQKENLSAKKKEKQKISPKQKTLQSNNQNGQIEDEQSQGSLNKKYDHQISQKRCNICDSILPSTDQLISHFINEHKIPAQNIDSYLSKYYFETNQLINKCGCGKKYQSISGLHKHVKMIHDGVWQQGTLKFTKHKKLYHINHTKPQKPLQSLPPISKTLYTLLLQVDKPYKCGCGRQYSHASTLKNHIMIHHEGIVQIGTIQPNENEQEQKKEQEKQIKNNNQIIIQIQQESNESDVASIVIVQNSHKQPIFYVKKEADSNEITQNQNINQQNIYSCLKCGLQFIDSENLKLHINDNHAEQQHIQEIRQQRKKPNRRCAICGITYPSKTFLDIHIAEKHSNNHKLDQKIKQQYITKEELQKYTTNRIKTQLNYNNLQKGSDNNSIYQNSQKQQTKGEQIQYKYDKFEEENKKKSNQEKQSKSENYNDQDFYRNKTKNKIKSSQPQSTNFRQNNKTDQASPPLTACGKILQPKCSFCWFSCISKNQLIAHFMQIHNMPILAARQYMLKNYIINQFINKCGCGSYFEAQTSLRAHISQKHGGVQPSGTSNNLNMKLSNEDQSLCKCACGKKYSCNSALNLHIRNRHGGISLPGTVRGTLVKQKTTKTQQKPSILQKQDLRYQATSENFHHSSKKQSEKTQNINGCQVCGQIFENHLYLRLHIEQQHPQQHQKYGHKRNKMISAQCKICGQSCPSRQSLFIHMKNKHSSKITKMQYNQNVTGYQYQCACGRIFQSKNLLNTHVERSHNGIFLKGCIKTPIYKSETSHNGQSQQSRTSLLGFNNQENNAKKDRSIYNSQSSEQQVSQNKLKNEPEEQIKQQINKVFISQQKTLENQSQSNPVSDKKSEKRYKCGCGRSYVCASSLNLHIKSLHNWIIPVGTIGGPRGLWRVQNQLQFIENNKQIRNNKTNVICTDCGQTASNPYYNCKTCPQHNLCQQCFWAMNQLSRGVKSHEWVSMDG